MKFSFIVPVYNGEKYIERCLNNLINQTYSNFEIIIINDGSTDNSKEILKNFTIKHKNKINLIDQENKGLSVSRNIGISKAQGDYLLFIDIDDIFYINGLKIINENLDEKYDLIKFNWTSNKDLLGKAENMLQVFSGPEALENLINRKQVFEMATLYAYRKEYVREIDFKFKEGRYHEDFGSIPIIILKAKNILFLNQVFYFYDQTNESSIIRTKNYNKILNKAKDILLFFIELEEEIKKISIDKKTEELFMSYNANAVISKINELKGNDKQEYVKAAKKVGVLNALQKTNLKQKIKYWYLKFKYYKFL